MNTPKYDLEDRLISFSVSCIELAKEISFEKTGYILANQLVRSSTSSALNYGEAQSSVSRKDFVHRMKIVLKELRENKICLKIIDRAFHNEFSEKTTYAIGEASQLIAIFVKSIDTAQQSLTLKSNDKSKSL